MYFSEECRKNEDMRHHKVVFEDFHGTALEKSIKMLRETCRMATDVNELLLLLLLKDKTVFDFDLSNRNHPRYKKCKLIALNGLSKSKNWRFRNDSWAAFRILQHPVNAEQRGKLSEFVSDQIKICHENMTKIQVGCEGIFMLKSLLNHSCIPNVSPFQFGKKSALIVIRLVKSIKCGD